MCISLTASNYKVQEQTIDGRMLEIRSIRADDKEILQEGMHHLSKRSLYARFFTFKSELSDAELKYFTEVDFKKHVGLVASITDSHGQRPVGVGRYIMEANCPTEATAELAFTVAEEYQGMGIGTLLMKHLVKIGRAQNVRFFTAYVMPDNKSMLSVLFRAGLPIECEQDSAGILELKLKLSTDTEAASKDGKLLVNLAGTEAVNKLDRQSKKDSEKTGQYFASQLF